MKQNNIQKILGAILSIHARYVWIIILIIMNFPFMLSYNKIYGCDIEIYNDDDFLDAITQITDSTIINMEEFQILSHTDSTYKYILQVAEYPTMDIFMDAVIPAVETSILTFRKETGYTGSINIYDRGFGRFAILIPDGIKMNNRPKDFDVEKILSERRKKHEHDVQFVNNHLKYNNYINGREFQANDSTHCSEDVIMLVWQFSRLEEQGIYGKVVIELWYPDYITNQIIDYYWLYTFEIPDYIFYDSDKMSAFEDWCELHNIDLHNIELRNNYCLGPWRLTSIFKEVKHHNMNISQ